LVEWQYKTVFPKFPHAFFIISGLYHIGSLDASKHDRMTCSWRCISGPSKWRSLCIWEIASYISSIANIYALLDKLAASFAAKMQRNAAASLLVRYWIFVWFRITERNIFNNCIVKFISPYFPGILCASIVSTFSVLRIKSLRQIISRNMCCEKKFV